MSRRSESVCVNSIKVRFRPRESLETSEAVLIARYMLRYLKGTQTLKNLIQEKGLTVMSVSARLVTAYELAVKVVSLSLLSPSGPELMLLSRGGMSTSRRVSGRVE
jgi:hypothetical protein